MPVEAEVDGVTWSVNDQLQMWTKLKERNFTKKKMRSFMNDPNTGRPTKLHVGPTVLFVDM